MRAALFLIALVFIGPYMLFADGAIRQDFSLRGELLVPAFVETTDRRCTSTLMVFHQCSFGYSLDGVEQKQKYNMFAFGAPDTIILLKGMETGRLTSTTGQDYLWNRVVTLILLLLLSLFTFIGLLKKLVHEATPSAPDRQRAPAPARAPQTASGNHRLSANKKGASFGTRTSF